LPEAQTARDRGDCDMLDSVPSVDDNDDDGVDLFFDAFDVLPPDEEDCDNSNEENWLIHSRLCLSHQHQRSVLNLVTGVIDPDLFE